MSPGATLLLFFGGSGGSTTYAGLLEALSAYMDADATLNALATGGVWVDELPANRPYPYVVVEERVGNQTNESGTATLEQIDFSISIFAADKAVTTSIMARIDTILTDVSLTFTEGTLLHFRLDTVEEAMELALGANSIDVFYNVMHWQSVVGN